MLVRDEQRILPTLFRARSLQAGAFFGGIDFDASDEKILGPFIAHRVWTGTY
jgi:hypothetical protein